MLILVTLFGYPAPTKEDLERAEQAVKKIKDSFGMGVVVIDGARVVHVASPVTDKNGNSQELVAFISPDELPQLPGFGYHGDLKEEVNIFNQVARVLSKSLGREILNVHVSLF